MEPDRELEELRARVAQLESLVERLARGGTSARPHVRREPAPPTANAGLDRRRMLRNGLGLSAAAVAGVGMVDALGSSAAAADADTVKVAQTVSPGAATSDPTRITNPSSSAHSSVLLQVDNATDTTVSSPSNSYIGILGAACGHDDNPKDLIGVLGMSDFGVGVQGHSDGDVGVFGNSPFGTAVLGTTSSGTAVVANANSTGRAVEAVAGSGTAILATSDSGEAIHATSTSYIGIVGKGMFGIVGNGTDLHGDPGGTGVGATGDTGVMAQGVTAGIDAHCDHGTAVKAASTDGTGVAASSTDGPGVVGTSGSAPGVHGVSGIGPGIKAESRIVAIEAVSDEGGAISATSGGGVGISVLNHGPQEGVAVNNTHSAGNAAGILSNTVNHGSAFLGSTANQRGTQPAGTFITQGSGPGVEGSSRSGVGGHFIGNRAAIRLFPQKHSGHPMKGKHDMGELLVAADGRLWMCTKAGSPGQWRQIAFV